MFRFRHKFVYFRIFHIVALICLRCVDRVDHRFIFVVMAEFQMESVQQFPSNSTLFLNRLPFDPLT